MCRLTPTAFGFAAIATAVTLLPIPRAQAQSLQEYQNALQLAVCQNDWARAIQLTGPVIASPQITAASRADMVAFRRQLEDLQNQRAVVTGLPNCSALIRRYLPDSAAEQSDQPLEWDGSFVTLAGGSRFGISDQMARQQAGLAQAGLTQTQFTEIPALSPAIPIDTRTGMGVSAGAVGMNRDIFSFVGAQGDTIAVDVEVTRILQGSIYTDDDSQIFLFDSQGRLLAENDDLDRLQSQIMSFDLPTTGTYYIAVTTYNNDPILNPDRTIDSWSGNGGSAIEYTLSITGLTPTEQLVLPAH